MKVGETVFFHCGGDVNLYCTVRSISPDVMTFDVINGAYVMTIQRADPPATARDYNSAMNWFRETFLGKQRKTIKLTEEQLLDNSDDIPF